MHGYLKYHNRSFWKRSHKSSQLMIVIRNLVKLNKNDFLYGQFWSKEIKGKQEKLSLKFPLDLNAERINSFFDAWGPGLTNKKQIKDMIKLHFTSLNRNQRFLYIRMIVCPRSELLPLQISSKIFFLIIGGSAVTTGKFYSTTVGKPIHCYRKTFLSIKPLWCQFCKLVFL